MELDIDQAQLMMQLRQMNLKEHSYASLPSPAPTYKMSKKRAQQLRSAPSTPPGELKVIGDVKC